METLITILLCISIYICCLLLVLLIRPDVFDTSEAEEYKIPYIIVLLIWMPFIAVGATVKWYWIGYWKLQKRKRYVEYTKNK